MNFQTWLINTGKSKKSAKNYSGAITGVMSNWAKEAILVKDSLLEITSTKQLQSISKKLSNLDIFIARNTKGNNMYSSALKAYSEYLADISSEVVQEDIDSILQDKSVGETEKATLIVARVGQGKFRKGLIDYWSGCAVTGFPDTRFLVASHIKPWKNSENPERLDTFNGLLLLPNIDKAFDLGYVSFKQQGKIILSPELECADVLGINAAMSVQLDEGHQEYMAFHRNEVFKKR